MDSRMLNVFQEDPFEGSFAKYETEPDFWSPNNDLELTSTLNGILPIAPTDESLLTPSREEDMQNRENLLIYSDFVEQQLDGEDANLLNAKVYSEVEAVYDQQRHISALVDFDREDDTHDEDVRSQCSNSTFRTRTDSSSIGDYESHSSDYEDEYDDIVDGDLNNGTAPSLHQTVISERKMRTLSTNTITSETDAFGLNIDVNNFDLADFITKDDFSVNVNACRKKEAIKTQAPAVKIAETVRATAIAPVPAPVPTPAPTSAPNRPLKVVAPRPSATPSKGLNSDDDDSDSIIDVETVDVVEVDETLWATGQATDDLCFVDNVKADPSWCPKTNKKPSVPPVKEVTPQQAEAPVIVASKPKTAANICLVPNKKQCEFLKRKVGSSVTSKTSKLAAKKAHDATKNVSNKQPAVSQVQGKGLGSGGKNLSLLKQEREAAAAVETSVPPSPTITPSPTPTATPTPSTATATKRKLNLEEYKQRRCGGAVAIPKTKPTPAKQAKLEAPSPSPIPAVKQTPSPQKAVIANIVNSLKCPSKEANAVPMDPITVAKNKVLRMIEMKRAQQLKIIDSRVSAKVPRVTKLPPLKDIVKDTYCMEVDPEPTPAQQSNKLHPDYEEIIIVSVSCNTDITIPPNQLSKASPRSLLKSSVLLYNISNGQDANKNMSNSLIASIQSEVVRQTSCTALASLTQNAAAVQTSTDKNVQHGEDMVIMHLPKDRMRKTLVSMATQTDLQPEFPLLALPTVRKSRERTRRNYRKRRCHRSASGSNGSSSSSSNTDCSSLASSRSRSNSIEQLRDLETSATGGGSSIGHGGGYSSRSTHRHRSSVSSSSYSEAGKYERRQRRTSYNKRRSKNQKRSSFSTSGSASENSDRERSRSPHRRVQRSRSRSRSDTRCQSNNNRRGFTDRNVSQPAVEERRIVYVGRIEQETTKELLRRKFLPYGSIKQITIHYKENGMKYGFVTYERAQDAFTAIDTSPRDPQINMYDISFGGRRAFCRASYADLDNAGINNYHTYVFPQETPAPKVQEEDSFEALLRKVKAKLNSGKPAPSEAAPAALEAQPVAQNQDQK
ncbi:hypothetical protein KR032_011531 [Drosophila birchii]|nr:hypothetical protein KR032_011531 [Drosophila birchii]